MAIFATSRLRLVHSRKRPPRPGIGVMTAVTYSLPLWLPPSAKRPECRLRVAVLHLVLLSGGGRLLLCSGSLAREALLTCAFCLEFLPRQVLGTRGSIVGRRDGCHA